jgi:uncharacterized protein
MGEREQYTAGTFSWADLTTTDQPAAKAFYTGLFGWEAEDRPIGEGIFYSIMQVAGRDVAAISPQPQQQRDAGVPPVWNSYVTVDDADASLARAKELGGTVHAPAFDVFDAGRMGVIQDPQGAYLLLWQPRAHIGAGLVNAPGAIVWNELATPDLDAASDFYSGLFGWHIAPVDGSPTKYLSIEVGEAMNGGMREPSPPGTPPHWLVYFAVEDIDVALAKVEQLGGKKLFGPQDIQIAKIAVAQDTQGAVFALYAGRLEP